MCMCLGGVVVEKVLWLKGEMEENIKIFIFLKCKMRL